MAILIIFVLGVGNFAMHRAVLASRHPMLRESRWFSRLGGRVGLSIEFAFLLAAFLLATYASPMWAWAYLGYTLINGLGAWLILSRRV